MIHHLFTLWADGHPVAEILDMTASSAVYTYAVEHAASSLPGQLTVAAWKDGAWCGYFKAYFGRRASGVEPITTPECFEPLPCPKATPAVTAPAFASCDPAAQQVAFMALESRARSLGLEAEEHRSVGHDELADILVGQQAACVAALDVLKGVGR
mgnify:CR=1 FL=1